jgi:hypothetical protein
MAKRTNQQSKAMHLYFTMVAEELDRQGESFQNIVSKLKNAEIRPTPENIKQIWKEFQIAMFNKKSTTELEKGEVDRVYEMFNAWLGREFEIFVPFPNSEPDIAELTHRNLSSKK